jgi:hypothetical protein
VFEEAAFPVGQRSNKLLKSTGGRCCLRWLWYTQDCSACSPGGESFEDRRRTAEARKLISVTVGLELVTGSVFGMNSKFGVVCTE